MSGVHATWGNWFVREEVEAIDQSGLLTWYLDCNGFSFWTGKVVGHRNAVADVLAASAASERVRPWADTYSR